MTEKGTIHIRTIVLMTATNTTNTITMWNIHVKMKYGSKTKHLVLANVINHDHHDDDDDDDDEGVLDADGQDGTDATVDDSQDIKLP